MTPMPTRWLAPRTRFQDAAVKAAAVPALIKLRRVNSGRGFDWDKCMAWVIIIVAPASGPASRGKPLVSRRIGDRRSDSDQQSWRDGLAVSGTCAESKPAEPVFK